MARRALVAGATGALGSKVAAELSGRGWAVRGLTRSRSRLPSLSDVHEGDALNAASLSGAADGCELVFSSVGASVMPGLRGWSPFTSLDVRANLSLIAEAKRAGVKRFVYVSVHHVPQQAGLGYIAAHERVVQALAQSGLDHVVVRPTGFFSALAALLDLARGGSVPSLGDGQKKSNPIDDRDLARVCAEACDGSDRELSAGGPEVLTRDQMAEAAFAALGKPVKLRHAPVAVAKVASVMLWPFHPRMAQLTAFIASLSEHDVVAPVRGTRRLADYFIEQVAARAAGITPQTASAFTDSR